MRCNGSARYVNDLSMEKAYNIDTVLVMAFGVAWLLFNLGFTLYVRLALFRRMHAKYRTTKQSAGRDRGRACDTVTVITNSVYSYST